jgi:NAD(P)H dehydrogenase (quinone)
MTSQFHDTAPVLVTGSTGQQGGSGRQVVKDLIAQGLRVRALVRKLDDRAEAIRALGAEIVVGDYANYQSLLAALEDVKAAYFCHPVAAGIAEAAGLFVTAGRAQGLDRVVDLSLGSSSPDAPSPQARAQWVAEKIFEWAGFGGVHLRIAAFFMENVALIDAPFIRAGAGIANAFGDFPLTWISGADVGSMAASLIANPELTTERVITACGVERLTYPQVAETVSTVLGRAVPYRELTPAAWRELLISASAAAGEANVRGAEHLVAQSIAIKASAGLPVTDQVRQITGREPTSFAAFVASRRGEFLSAA